MNSNEKMNADVFEDELERIVGDNIAEDVLDEIDFLEQYKALWKKDKPWNGYTVYSPYFDGKPPTIGLLNVVLVKDRTARLATTDETLAYLEYLEIEDAKEKSTGELKAEQIEGL
jgi:hypothetical protein